MFEHDKSIFSKVKLPTVNLVRCLNLSVFDTETVCVLFILGLYVYIKVYINSFIVLEKSYK